MWKWYSADGSGPATAAPGMHDETSTMSVTDISEQLAQTQQLVVQLKELIREKDNQLQSKDQQLKEEKEASDSKLSKAKLQNKARVASLSSQLEELKKQLAAPGSQQKKSDNKKASGDGEQENAAANRGKILVLRRKVEDLESQVSKKNEELQRKIAEMEAQRLRGSEMDALLIEKEKKLAEKEAYIIELQMAIGSSLPPKDVPALGEDQKDQVMVKDSAQQDMQMLIQNLTRKVGDSEEKYSLLQEQTESLKNLLTKERGHFQEREAMYVENIRMFQNIIQEKEKELIVQAQNHELELFKLAAKSDASADLEQLLKALKQKLHEKEEVLLGRNQVIDILQKELDAKDQQLKEINERSKRLQSEKDNLQSKLDAEKHVMRAQLRDMMDKHQVELKLVNGKHKAEVQEIQEKHEMEIQEKDQVLLQLQKQVDEHGSSGQSSSGQAIHTDSASKQQIGKLEAQVKLKTEEVSKSEAKFFKLKALSKSKIKQLEDELKSVQSASKNKDMLALNVRISDLENEKEELQNKLEALSAVKTLNEELHAKLELYEEQQRKLQADLEQVTKRAASQTSESGSADELQNQVLEWQEMMPGSEEILDNLREEKSAIALRMVQIEEEREGLIEDDWFFPGCSDPAIVSGQQDLEEELTSVHGMGRLLHTRRKGNQAAKKPQGEYGYDSQRYEDSNITLDSVDSSEGENMGGLQTVVEELELERNQLQEQIMALEERCQDLEDRLQLQVRIESLQNENERLQTQLMQLRAQFSRESEMHQALSSNLNEQLKGLSDRKLFLETSLMEKEQKLLETAGKLEQITTLKQSFQEQDVLNKDLAEKLVHSEQQLEETKKKCESYEMECAELKVTNNDLTDKVNTMKEKTSKQELSLEIIKRDFDQTNEELDRLNTNHLEERSQLIHDLQRCERENDSLKETIEEKEKEMASLSSSMVEYSEQLLVLKQQMQYKEEEIREMEDNLVKTKRECNLLREAQTSDVQDSSLKMSALTEKLDEMELELNMSTGLNEAKANEIKELIRQINEYSETVKDLRSQIQIHTVAHRNHVVECEAQILLLKEQINVSAEKLLEKEAKYKQETENLCAKLEESCSSKEELSNLLKEKETKENNFESELKSVKDQNNQLISEVARKDEELATLSKQLQDHIGHQETLKLAHQEKEEAVALLQENLQEARQHSEDIKLKFVEKLKAKERVYGELKKQLKDKSEIIDKLEALQQEFALNNKHLQATLEEKEVLLSDQIKVVSDLTKGMNIVESSQQHLMNENNRLLKQIHEKESDILKLSNTVLELENKILKNEEQVLDYQNNISLLRHDKDELIKKVEHFSVLCEQKDISISSELLEKTKECNLLSEKLSVNQESIQCLHNEMHELGVQLNEVKEAAQEKEDALKNALAQCTTLNEQLHQNQERMEIFEKQIQQLTADLAIKRKTLQETCIQFEEKTCIITGLQNEAHIMKAENTKLTQWVEERNATLKQKNTELENLHQLNDRKAEENIILNSQLEMLCKEIDKLKIDKEEVLVTLSTKLNEYESIHTQATQNKSEVVLLKQQAHTLELENKKIKTDIEITHANMTKKTEEIAILSSHLSKQGHIVLALQDQIDNMKIEKQKLLDHFNEKEGALAQRETLIQEIKENKLKEEGRSMQTISDLQNQLQHLVLETTQLRQTIQDKESELSRQGQEIQLFKDKSEESDLFKCQLSENMEVISDLHFQIKNLNTKSDELNQLVFQKEESLKQKVGDYVNLKAKHSEMEDLSDLQQKQLEALMVEANQLKSDILEKERLFKSTSHYTEELKLKLQDKEIACEFLRQQVKNLEAETLLLKQGISNQKIELSDLKVSMVEKDNSIIEKENLIKNLKDRASKEETCYSQLEEKMLTVTQLQSQVHTVTNELIASKELANEKEKAFLNLQEKCTAYCEQIHELNKTLGEKQDNISELLKSLNEKDNSIQLAEGNARALTNEIEILRDEIKKHASLLKNINRIVEEKDTIISVNQKTINSLSVDLETANMEYRRNMDQISALKHDLQQKVLNMESFQEKCLEQSQHIENLKSDMKNLNSVSSEDLYHKTLLMENLQLQIKNVVKEKQLLLEDIKRITLENENVVATYKEQLHHQSEELKELNTKMEHSLKDAELEINAVTLQMKNEKEQLQKQVSVNIEEISILKQKIENLELSIFESESKWKAEHVVITQENDLLKDKLNHIENELTSKDNKIQSLQQDLFLIDDIMNGSEYSDEQLKVINAKSHRADNLHIENKSRLEKLSFTMSIIGAKEREIAQLNNILSVKERECGDILQEQNKSMTLQNDIEKLCENHQSEMKHLLKEITLSKEEINRQQSLIEKKDQMLSTLDTHVSFLQEQMNNTVEELQKNSEKLNADGAKILNLLEEIRTKEDIIENLTCQIKQQKDLISALSNQLKEKDVSVSQVMESMSNEMVTFSEEKCFMKSRIDYLESVQSHSVEDMTEVSQNLEECKKELELHKVMLTHRDTKLTDLIHEQDQMQVKLETIIKEKAVLKKKLQASLVIRKDLLQKCELLEKTGQDEVGKEKMKAEAAMKGIDELTYRLESIETQNEELESHLKLLKNQLLEKDSDVNTLSEVLAAKEYILEQCQNNIKELNNVIKQKEYQLQEYLKYVKVKDIMLDKVQSDLSERETTFKDCSKLIINFDHLKIANDEKEDQLKPQSIEPLISARDCSDHGQYVYSDNQLCLVQIDTETSIKKVQASGVFGKETMMKPLEEKDDAAKDKFDDTVKKPKVLQDDHNIIRDLNQGKCKECEINLLFILSLQDKITCNEGIISEKEKNMNKCNLESEEKQNTMQITFQEKINAYDKEVVKLMSEVTGRDLKLDEVNNKYAQVLKESEVLREDVRKRSVELSEKTEEIAQLKYSVMEFEQKHKQDKEILMTEICQLQKKVEISTIEVNHINVTLEKISNEKEAFIKRSAGENQASQKLEFDLKESLKQGSIQIIEKNEAIATLHCSLNEKRCMLDYEKEASLLQESVKETLEVSTQTKFVFEEIKSEFDGTVSIVDKTKSEICKVEAQVSHSCKGNELFTRAHSADENIADINELHFQEENENVQWLHLMSEMEIPKESLHSKENYIHSQQDDCIRQDRHIAELENQIQQHNVVEYVGTQHCEMSKDESQDTQIGGKCNSKEHLQRKLHTALISHKELQKENKYLKEKIDSLILKKNKLLDNVSILENSLAELGKTAQNNDLVSSLYQEKDCLVLENARLLTENENLSAACESLKSIMETIVQEKEAFSIQLNSLQESQMAELSGWKAKYSELNKEYESLLQAYENISNEMDKMRQIIELIRKEKHDVLHRFLDLESKNLELEKQIHSSHEENENLNDNLSTIIKSKDAEIQKFQSEAERLSSLLKSTIEEKYLLSETTLENSRLIEENNKLKGISENIKMDLQRNRNENDHLQNGLRETKSILGELQSQMDLYKSEICFKLDGISNDRESLIHQVTCLTNEISEKMLHITNVEQDRSLAFEKCKEAEEALEQKNMFNCKLESEVKHLKQHIISLNEKVKHLEDDKCLLQEELENIQEHSENIKYEKECLETEIRNNVKQIDHLTDTLKAIQLQNCSLTQQLEDLKMEKCSAIHEEKEQQLQLVREFEEKVKGANRKNSGTQNKSKELKELLKEKQQEIQQLQKDSIQFQELILDLERTLQISQSKSETFEKDLNSTGDALAKSHEEGHILNEKLNSYKNALDEAKTEIASLTSNNLTLQEELKLQKIEFERKIKFSNEELNMAHKEELRSLHEIFDSIRCEKDRIVDKFAEIKNELGIKDLRNKTLQSDLNTNMARLAAFTPCMSSPQNDRDQALVELKPLENQLKNAIQNKEQKIDASNLKIMLLEDELKEKGAQIQELAITYYVSEGSQNVGTLKAHTNIQHSQKLACIQKNNSALLDRLHELEITLQSKENLLQSPSCKNYSFKHPTTNTTDSFKEVEIMETKMMEKEQEWQRVSSENAELHASLQKHLVLTRQMKLLLSSKDSEISMLISSKGGDISGYLTQIQTEYKRKIENYAKQLSVLQTEKEQSDEAFRRMENEFKNLMLKGDQACHEKSEIANEIEALIRSILPHDRFESTDEEKHHKSMLGQNESAIVESTGKNINLKQEVRNLLNEIDDLHSENAMLRAQLIRYREDLNQVLSLKDHQLKELLKQQLDHIKNLEQEKCNLQKEHKEMQRINILQNEKIDILQHENGKILSKSNNLESLIATINKDNLVSESKEKQKSGILVNRDHTKMALKIQAQDKRGKIQKTADNEDAEDLYKRLASRHNIGPLEHESETLNEITEKCMLEVKYQNADLKSQNESFGKAMAALQNDRDRLIEDFKVLQNKYVSELKSEQIRGDNLNSKLSDFESRLSRMLEEENFGNVPAAEDKDALDQLDGKIKNLCHMLVNRDLEITRLSSECDNYAHQIDAFSKAMASLQDDRDRLRQQLRELKIVHGNNQGVTSVIMPSDPSSNRNIGLQNEKLGHDLSSRTNAEMLQLKSRVDDLERALQKAKAFQERTEHEVSSYQSELAELRTEKSLLMTEARALRDQCHRTVAEKDRQIAELQKYHREIISKESTSITNIYAMKALESSPLVGNANIPDQVKQLLAEKNQLQHEMHRCLQEMHQREQHFQQMNAKDDLRAEVPPGAPQERASVIVEIDNMELSDLRKRLVEIEQRYDSSQQEVSQLEEKLEEERTRREAAEEALILAEQEHKRLGASSFVSVPREYEYAVQMESDDEREALIIDPREHIVVRKMRGGALSVRRWLRGRSIYCSKLLTSRAKSRYLFLTYLVTLHIVVVLCLAGVI